MIKELKKLFVYGEIDPSKDIIVSKTKGKPQANSAQIAVVGTPQEDSKPVEGEFPVSPRADDKPMSVETSLVSSKAAQAQNVKHIEAIPAEVVCCGDPTVCDYAKYSEGMNGFYRYYCNRFGHPLPCDAPEASKHEQHYTELENSEPVYDDDHVYSEEDFVDEDETPLANRSKCT